MRVFLSWSGEQSKAVALSLRRYLKLMVQRLDPWMSEDDIGKGTVPFLSIMQELEKARAGIICFTHFNLESEWLNFEAGALAQRVGAAHEGKPEELQKFVCPYLFAGVANGDLQRRPLSNFQATRSEKVDTRRLVSDLNAALDSEFRLKDEVLNDSFERWWPDLERDFARIATIVEKEPPRRARRPEDDFEEVLLAVSKLPVTITAQLGAVVDRAVREALWRPSSTGEGPRGRAGQAEEPVETAWTLGEAFIGTTESEAHRRVHARPRRVSRRASGKKHH